MLGKSMPTISRWENSHMVPNDESDMLVSLLERAVEKKPDAVIHELKQADDMTARVITLVKLGS